MYHRHNHHGGDVGKNESKRRQRRRYFKSTNAGTQKHILQTTQPFPGFDFNFNLDDLKLPLPVLSPTSTLETNVNDNKLNTNFNFDTNAPDITEKLHGRYVWTLLYNLFKIACGLFKIACGLLFSTFVIVIIVGAYQSYSDLSPGLGMSLNMNSCTCSGPGLNLILSSTPVKKNHSNVKDAKDIKYAYLYAQDIKNLDITPVKLLDSPGNCSILVIRYMQIELSYFVGKKYIVHQNDTSNLELFYAESATSRYRYALPSIQNSLAFLNNSQSYSNLVYLPDIPRFKPSQFNKFCNMSIFIHRASDLDTNLPSYPLEGDEPNLGMLSFTMSVLQIN